MRRLVRLTGRILVGILAIGLMQICNPSVDPPENFDPTAEAAHLDYIAEQAATDWAIEQDMRRMEEYYATEDAYRGRYDQYDCEPDC